MRYFVTIGKHAAPRKMGTAFTSKHSRVAGKLLCVLPGGWRQNIPCSMQGSCACDGERERCDG
jgi:hypothetical protein